MSTHRFNKNQTDRMASILAIHAEMMRRLAKHQFLTLPQWGEILEDVGNRYLDIAECIRQSIISAAEASQESQPLSDQTTRTRELLERCRD